MIEAISRLWKDGTRNVGRFIFQKEQRKKIPKKWSSTLHPIYCKRNRTTFLPSAKIWPQKKAKNQSKETSSLWQTHANILAIIIILTALPCVLMTTCLEENKCTSGCSFCTQKYEVWGEKRISTQEEESMLCSHIEDVPQHGTFSWSLQEELKFPACHAVITSVWCIHGTFQISSHKVSAHSTRILRKWKFCVNGMFLRHTSLFPASKGKISFWGFI